ncbi:MAG TPA: hypothetical protein VLB87_09405 [Pyrinomonadaceae bacterium]|nr:hypothetical protein [Pyrinomonadaceae bacterium]
MTYQLRTIAGFLVLVLLVAACSSSPATTKRAKAVAAAAPAAVVFPAEFGSGFKKEEFERHVEELKKRLPSKEFTIVVQPPFVVVGDEPASVVQERAEGTIKWAVEKLKQDFFTDDPKEILDIWLFRSAYSYEKHALELFKAKPHTPYGYYSSEHKSLIMNISTGGGTLVHEIVHPFIEANFPACPPWLNEGMGSLYEQCGEQDGHIHGFVNWRLPGLQKAIKAGTVPAFRTLMAMDPNLFYGDRSGVNYAQARYLCYYLQEKGLLVKFYKQFLARREKDPSGFETLKAVLRESDMDQFKRRWERYVLQLTE